MELSEWRALRQAGEEAQLPSGLVVRVKRVGLLDLAAQGQIPQTLQPQIDAIANLAKKGQAPDVSELREMTGLLDVVCGVCIVWPVELEVAELDFTDKMAIFEWANEVAHGLKTFRSQPIQPVGIGYNGAALRATA